MIQSSERDGECETEPSTGNVNGKMVHVSRKILIFSGNHAQHRSDGRKKAVLAKGKAFSHQFVVQVWRM